jgi:predicted RND superfamily exporter protein
MSWMSPFFARRWALAVVTLVVTAVLGAFAGKVRPDYSIEQIFPTFDKSRVDYERFKKDFPFEDAHAIVVVQAPDLFTAAGLQRVSALEEDLARIPGVVDTQSLASVRNVVSDGVTLTMEKLFPAADLPADELARRRATATADPLFRWDLATPDGRATTILVTLTRETASKEENRTAFFQRARAVVADHDARAHPG